MEEGHQIGQTLRSAPTNIKLINISNNKTNLRWGNCRGEPKCSPIIYSSVIGFLSLCGAAKSNMKVYPVSAVTRNEWSMKSKKCCHPEPSQSEGVRISYDDDAPVTLRIRFVNPWGSHPLSFLKDGILTSQNTLLRMTGGLMGFSCGKAPLRMTE